jgi:selenocysteine lyase/cysteine desulfurase
MNRRDLFATPLLGLMPPASLRESDPETYWTRIREQEFHLPGWRCFLNNGSLGVAPRRVVRRMKNYLETAASLVNDDYPRWGYETLDDERAAVAAFAGCKKEELAFTHNATEALSTVAEGIDLKPGDEVVLTDHEHPSGLNPWLRRARRDGITMREVKIPHPPKDPAQLADLLISAIGPKTRVLSFSGILSPTGILLPVREICAAARAKGVLTLVDGAHMNGQVPFRIDELNCDFFAGSPHKWMFAPAGCGILYVREEHIERLWPTIVTGGWDDPAMKAGRFMRLGTNNRATVEGMMEGLRFLQEIGPDAIYARIHSLARTCLRMARERSYIQPLTPGDDRMYGSLVCLTFPGKNLDPLWEAFKKRRIWTIGSTRMRVSCHIHTRLKDLEYFFETLDEVLGKQA